MDGRIGLLGSIHAAVDRSQSRIRFNATGVGVSGLAVGFDRLPKISAVLFTSAQEQQQFGIVGVLLDEFADVDHGIAEQLEVHRQARGLTPHLSEVFGHSKDFLVGAAKLLGDLWVVAKCLFQVLIVAQRTFEGQVCGFGFPRALGDARQQDAVPGSGPRIVGAKRQVMRQVPQRRRYVLVGRCLFAPGEQVARVPLDLMAVQEVTGDGEYPHRNDHDRQEPETKLAFHRKDSRNTEADFRSSSRL